MVHLKRSKSLVALTSLEEKEASEEHENFSYLKNHNEQEIKQLEAQLINLEEDNKRLEAQLQSVQVCIYVSQIVKM